MTRITCLLAFAASTFAASTDETAEKEELLSALAGEFELTSTFWQEPGAKPELTRLDAKRTLTLGGRVLRIEVSEEDGFLGTGLMGFDTSKGKYWYVWTDTSVSGRSVIEGELDSTGAGEMTGETPTPAGYTPMEVSIRNEDGAEIHEYRSPGPDGRVFRWLELRYVRR